MHILRQIPLLMAALWMAGCSDSGQPETSSTENTPAQATEAADIAPVVVYSSRQEHLIKPVFDRFTEDTGIEVRYQTGEEGPLIARLAAEGEGTPADVLYTVDAGNLWSAADRGLLAPLDSELLFDNIPAHLRDPQDRWFGLSVRARTIVYSEDRVDPAALSTYEALAEPEWDGRLCLRTSKKVYNMSLVATMIERLGRDRTEEIVAGWVDNLATRVFSSDTLLLEAIAAGQCDVGIVNTYYLGRLLAEDPDFPVGLFWANQDSSGVHVNVSGAGMTQHANNPEGARRLLEWLSTEEPQQMFSEMNLEFPANPAIPATELVQSWGDYQQDTLNVETAGRLQAEAVMLMDRVGYR